MKHTAKSLGKYIGKKVYINCEDLIGSDKSQLMIRINLGDSSSISVGFKDVDGSYEETSDCEPHIIYPILKKMEDLTDIPPQYDQWLFDIEEGRLLSSNFPAWLNRWFLKNNALAIPSKVSPTGLISIHDGLPCKAWGEVFK